MGDSKDLSQRAWSQGGVSEHSPGSPGLPPLQEEWDPRGN